MSRPSSEDKGTGWAIALICLLVLLLLSLVLLVLLVLCTLLTRLLFEHVVNPALGGALDSNDGLVVGLSAGFWGLLASGLSPLSLSPMLFQIPLDRIAEYLLLLVAIALAAAVPGVIFGLAVGSCVVLGWWWDVEKQAEPVLDLAGLLELSASGGLGGAPGPAAPDVLAIPWLETMKEGVVLGEEVNEIWNQESVA